MRTTILCALAVAVLPLSAQTQPPDNSNNSYSAGSKEDLSRLAGQMLENTNRARTAIKAGDHQGAIEDVNRAQSDLERIEARAHGATMIPVYSEFVSISILAPVHAEQSARNATVHEVSGDYTRVVVSTTVAKQSLGAAKAALKLDEWQKADAALSDVQEGVQMESVEADMPLARARENLILARAAVRQDHYPEAKAALNAAASALTNYEARDGSHVNQAKEMQAQIQQLAANVQQQHTDAIGAINGWWNTTSDWSSYVTQTSARR